MSLQSEVGGNEGIKCGQDGRYGHVDGFGGWYDGCEGGDGGCGWCGGFI